ncbi:unnamed protein product [Brassica rapa subsp. narinosa]|uniref:(rape) hypothetical protein n=1 Tax=Brassica napus TaxID=3708 RepID=A0A816P4G1_BRANA|nr:unnamed protein product [Brassica napus]
MKIFAYVGEKKDPLYRRSLKGDISVGPLGDGKYYFIVQYSDKKEEPRHQIILINPDYFTPRKDFIKGDIVHTPNILSNAVNSSGADQLSQAEKVLN